MTFTPRKSYGNFGSSQWMSYAVRQVGVAMPNCFTYATARISEIVGYDQPLDPVKVRGAGDLWETHSSAFTQSSVAIPGALAIYKGGYQNFGHVAVVEVVGVNMAMSQSNYGGNLFEFVEVPKTPGSYYPGTSLRLCGFLVHKALGASSTLSTGYTESQLINETGVATLTQAVNKRRDSPTGLVVETLPTGKKLAYTQKWVGNGHRYISWVETETNGNKYRYFVAISGSETHGKDMWATFGDNTASSSYSESQLINENGSCVLLQNINKRRDKPDGQIVETLPKGKVINYTQKWVGLGHRYVSWVEKESNGSQYRYFIAISNSETQGQELWVSFDTTTDQDITDTQTIEPVDTSNIKGYGVDVSELNPANFDFSKYDFAIIRIGYGTEHLDDHFIQYRDTLEKLGKPYGIYLYSYATADDEAESEANQTVEWVKKYLSDAKYWKLGIWYDMEDADDYKKKHGVLDRAHCLSFCQKYCKIIKDAGYPSGIYSSTWWFDNWLNEGLDSYYKWVAQWDKNDGDYHSDTSARGSIHQYTSIDKGTGIGLDKDVIYVDMDYFKDSGQKEDTKEPEDKDNQSDVKELSGLLSTLIGLLKKFLGIFGK